MCHCDERRPPTGYRLPAATEGSTTMINTNRDRLITMSVMGQVISPGYPGIPAIPHQIDKDGKPRLLPSLGGIVFNVKVGDPVFGWAGDNIEPGVAIKAPDAAANQALNVFACVGNEAVV